MLRTDGYYWAIHKLSRSRGLSQLHEVIQCVVVDDKEYFWRCGTTEPYLDTNDFEWIDSTPIDFPTPFET